MRSGVFRLAFGRSSVPRRAVRERPRLSANFAVSSSNAAASRISQPNRLPTAAKSTRTRPVDGNHRFNEHRRMEGRRSRSQESAFHSRDALRCLHRASERRRARSHTPSRCRGRRQLCRRQPLGTKTSRRSVEHSPTPTNAKGLNTDCAGLQLSIRHNPCAQRAASAITPQHHIRSYIRARDTTAAGQRCIGRPCVALRTDASPESPPAAAAAPTPGAAAAHSSPAQDHSARHALPPASSTSTPPPPPTGTVSATAPAAPQPPRQSVHPAASTSTTTTTTTSATTTPPTSTNAAAAAAAVQPTTQIEAFDRSQSTIVQLNNSSNITQDAPELSSSCTTRGAACAAAFRFGPRRADADARAGRSLASLLRHPRPLPSATSKDPQASQPTAEPQRRPLEID